MSVKNHVHTTDTAVHTPPKSSAKVSASVWPKHCYGPRLGNSEIIMKHTLFYFGVLTLGACGGKAEDPADAQVTQHADPAHPADGGTEGDASTAADAGTVVLSTEQRCAAVADRAQRCGQDRTHADDQCKSRALCIAAAMRDEGQPAYYSCLAARDCTASEDICVQQAALTVSQTTEDQAFAVACTSARARCGSQVSKNICDSATATLIRPEILKALTACSSFDCSKVDTCMGQAFSAAAPSCKSGGGGSGGSGGGSSGGSTPPSGVDAGPK